MVYITGDMHGDEERIYSREVKRLKSGDTLIICGDFGFIWDGSERERKLLEYLGSRRYNVCFIDGTHENFELLNKYRETYWKGGLVHRITGTLYHLCRGEMFNIEGHKIFTFGGGESFDKEMRSEHVTWWRDELPSPAEMKHGAKVIEDHEYQMDYIITHEPPSLVKSAILLRNGKIDRVNKLNGYLEEVNHQCTFKRWYFGCMHEDRVITPKHTGVFRELWPLEEK